ncbi:hypothetical protein HYH03_017373 [Edaphochlamys debaryana]|uniref:Uncharacterized protein n=1 Tax=Edaphochlamys debaryana TaxID=47281 RepID=A0A836BPC5_9CHLO|nr:hypothetical protein HYH03_017373 [Edaphochlamys debaryana]|eukprot:KAG2483777.1 hypothetical protein HYH03_017373 [Edaphochlamys debaryana]
MDSSSAHQAALASGPSPFAAAAAAAGGAHTPSQHHPSPNPSIAASPQASVQRASSAPLVSRLSAVSGPAAGWGELGDGAIPQLPQPHSGSVSPIPPVHAAEGAMFAPPFKRRRLYSEGGAGAGGGHTGGSWGPLLPAPAHSSAAGLHASSACAGSAEEQRRISPPAAAYVLRDVAAWGPAAMAAGQAASQEPAGEGPLAGGSGITWTPDMDSGLDLDLSLEAFLLEDDAGPHSAAFGERAGATAGAGAGAGTQFASGLPSSADDRAEVDTAVAGPHSAACPPAPAPLPVAHGPAGPLPPYANWTPRVQGESPPGPGPRAAGLPAGPMTGLARPTAASPSTPAAVPPASPAAAVPVLQSLLKAMKAGPFAATRSDVPRAPPAAPAPAPAAAAAAATKHVAAVAAGAGGATAAAGGPIMLTASADAATPLLEVKSEPTPLPKPVRVTVTVAAGEAPADGPRHSGRRRRRGGGGGSSDEEYDGEGDEDGRRSLAEAAMVGGRVVGVFHPAPYLEGGRCIELGGAMLTRSAFERVGGSNMAKWYRSIKVLPEGCTLGRWLTRHGLPVLKGVPRNRKAKLAAQQGAEGSTGEEAA